MAQPEGAFISGDITPTIGTRIAAPVEGRLCAATGSFGALSRKGLQTALFSAAAPLLLHCEPQLRH